MPAYEVLQKTDFVTIEVQPGTTSADDPYVVRISGRFNELVTFKPLADLLREKKVKAVDFDLAGVTDINSIGLREWLMTVEKLQTVAEIQFLKVSEVFVEQSNIVANVLGKPGTPVVEFEGPFWCRACRKRSLRPLKTADFDLSSKTFPVPEFKCGTCSATLEFDAIEQEFFRFLNHASPLKDLAKVPTKTPQ